MTATVEKKKNLLLRKTEWTKNDRDSQNFDLLSFKNLSPDQFLQSSN